RTVGRLAVDGYGLATLTALESVGGVIAAATWLFVSGLLLRASLRLPATPGHRWHDRTATGPVTVPQRGLMAAVLALLALKAVFEVVIAGPAGEALSEREGLRILLLHAFLLGAVSLGLATAMRSLLGRQAWRGLRWFALSIGLMLACLVPLTGLWPASWSGPWTLRAAFYSSLGPPLAALVTLSLSSPLARVGRAPGTKRSAAPEPSTPRA